MDMLSRAGSVSRSEVESELGVSRSKAGALLSGMKDKGALEEMGSGRGTRYRLR